MLEPTLSAWVTPSARTPPEVLFAPPPPLPKVNVDRVFYYIAAGLVLLGAVLYAALPASRTRFIVAAMVGGQGLIFAMVAAILGRVVRRQREAHRNALEQFAATPAPDARIMEFAQTLHARKAGRLSRRVVALNLSLPPPTPPRARVVCVGPLEPPPPGQYLFEPEIITPARYLGKRWIVVAIGGLLLLLILVRALRVFPWLNWMPLGWVGSFGYFYAMFAIFGGVWLWRGVIRPTYIRIAPGVIQVLRYRFRGGPPVITSFPLDAGTMVIAFGGGAPRRMTQLTMLIVARGEQVEMIPLAQMSLSAATIERIWHAMLSTAPLPPLSEEELVG